MIGTYTGGSSSSSKSSAAKAANGDVERKRTHPASSDCLMVLPLPEVSVVTIRSCDASWISCLSKLKASTSCVCGLVSAIAVVNILAGLNENAHAGATLRETTATTIEIDFIFNSG